MTAMGPIDFIFVTSYIVNFEFLLDEVPELLSLPRACVVYGSKEGTEDSWRQACTTLDGTCSVDFLCRSPSDPPHSATNPLPHRIPYGVHHTKMFLVGYATGALRVVIHTANLRFSDIHHKAQGAYIQDFPRKPTSSDAAAAPSSTTTTASTGSSAFEDSLIQYIETYSYNKKYQWDDHDSMSSSNKSAKVTLAEHLRKYDFSSAAAVLIPSTPGYHKPDQACPIGHLKLRREIERLGQQQHQQKRDTTREANSGPIVCQFSSIGSLTKKYLHRLVYSLDISRSAATSNNNSNEDDESKPLNNKLQLVYPTSDEICNSLEGYRGGASVPGTSKNVSKDFLQPLFRKWTASRSFLASLSLSKGDDDDDANANPLWKGNNVPHIKTYFQLDSNDEKEDGLSWLVLASHNLSKAAWGDVQNSTAHGEKRLFIRHWELGVLVAPSMLGAKRLVPWTKATGDKKTATAIGDVTVPLPYRHKPLAYTDKDKPWAVDQRYVRLDIFGRRSASDA